MACRCLSCDSGLPRTARFCPRCGVPARRPPVEGLAIALVLAGVLILLSNLTMRAVMMGGTHASMPAAPAAARLRGPVDVMSVLDIESNPGVLMDRSVPVGEMRLHGVRLGDAAGRIAGRFVTHSSKEEIRCYDGNAYACRDNAVSEIVVNDPAILLRIRCEECLNVFSRFGAPDAMEEVRGDPERIVFRYGSRGMVVRWNRRTSRIDQIVLRMPE